MRRSTSIVLSLLMLAVLAGSTLAGIVEDRVKEGNSSFRQEQYSDALEQYQIAETELPESPELDYNIAGVLHYQEKYEETIERYNKSLNSDNASIHFGAKYNLGSTYYRMGDYQNAISHFQEALELNPDDIDTKFNLELSRKMLKEQMKPENQEQEDQEKQEKQEKQDQEEQDKQDKQDQQQEEQKQDDQQDQDQEQQQQEQNQDQQQDSTEQQQQQQEKQISKEDAERILNALKDDEQDIQKKIKRQVSGGNYTGNDW